MIRGSPSSAKPTICSATVVRPKEVPEGFLAEWDAWCRANGWSASRQGRKIYTMPDAVCKSHAVPKSAAASSTPANLPVRQ